MVGGMSRGVHRPERRTFDGEDISIRDRKGILIDCRVLVDFRFWAKLEEGSCTRSVICMPVCEKYVGDGARL